VPAQLSRADVQLERTEAVPGRRRRVIGWLTHQFKLANVHYQSVAAAPPPVGRAAPRSLSLDLPLDGAAQTW
jgi:hypothetical protein